MKERIEGLRSRFECELAAAADANALEAIRVGFLGKKGEIAELMKGLRDVADKKSAGQLINSFKNEVEDAITKTEEMLKKATVDLNGVFRKHSGKG